MFISEFNGFLFVLLHFVNFDSAICYLCNFIDYFKIASNLSAGGMLKQSAMVWF